MTGVGGMPASPFPVRLELQHLLELLADHGHTELAPWVDPTGPDIYDDEGELADAR